MLVPSCCCDPVLLWYDNCYPHGGLSRVKTEYEDLGYTAHLHTPSASEYTGTLSDYRLIIWLMAESSPPWLGQIASGTWTGRLHFSGEFGNSAPPIPGFDTTNAYVNTLTGITGMSVNDLNSDGGPLCSDETATATGEPLTVDADPLTHADTNSVTGGTALYTSTILAATMMARNKVGNIEFVLCGDSSHLSDHCSSNVPLNRFFLRNLMTVAL